MLLRVLLVALCFAGVLARIRVEKMGYISCLSTDPVVFRLAVGSAFVWAIRTPCAIR